MSGHPQTEAARRRVHYEPDELLERFQVLLTDFTAACGASPVAAVLGADWVERLRRAEREIHTRLEEEFTIVVIGDFKRGKSTLINALLGEPLLATNATPETLTITELRQGPVLRAELRLTDGGRYPLDRAELRADRLAPILADFGDQVDRLEIQAPHPGLERLCLVDTPGTGDLFQRFETRVARHLREADLVLILVSPLSPLSASEAAFLQAAVASQDFPKVLFVLNMIDLAHDPDELERLVALLRRRTSDLLPMAELFPVSALDEMQRRSGGAPLNPALGDRLARGFEAFRQAVTEITTTSREAIQLDRAGHLLTDLLDQLDRRLAWIRATRATDHHQREQAIALAEQDITALEAQGADRQRVIRETITRLATEAAGWMQGFIDRMEREVVPQLVGQPTEAVQRHLAFFVTDRLHQAFDACLRTHQPILGSLVTTLGPVGDPTTPQASAESPAWMPALRPTITTGVGLLSLLSGLSGGLDFPLAALGNLVGVAERGAVKADYLQQLLAALPGLRHVVAETVEQSYQHLADHLIADLDSRSAAECELARSALCQARSLYSDQSRSQAETDALLARAQAVSTETRAALTQLLQQLWEGGPVSDSAP